MNFEGQVAKGKVPKLVINTRRAYLSHDLQGIIDVYHQTSAMINRAFKNRDVQNILFYTLSNLSLIEPYIEYCKKIDGEFIPISISSIDTGLIFFPVQRYLSQLKLTEDIIDTFDELEYYKKEVTKSYARYRISEYIHSKADKKIALSSIQEDVPTENQLIVETCDYLEQFKLIRQEKTGDAVFIVNTTKNS